MSDRFLLAGPGSEPLGRKVADRLNAELLDAEFKIFADGESKFTCPPGVSGKTVIVLQSTHPPVDQHMFQLLLASHCLSQEGAKVIAVAPYLAYARQDKEFLPGEGVTLGVISHLMRSVGIRRLVVVDIHSAEGLSLFSLPIYSVSAIPLLADFAKTNLDFDSPAVISPDFGGSKRTEAFAALYGGRFLKLAKTRDRSSGEVKVEEASLDVKGKQVIIVDDIISTGGTVKAAAEAVLAQGASDVAALCVHGLFVDNAYSKLEKAGVKTIVGTNTVPGEHGIVDVSGAIASHLATIEE